MNIIQEMERDGVIRPPKWLPGNIVYLARVGSQAYGTSTGNSDNDIYGICVPPLSVIFPHLDGEIPGFGTQKKNFRQYQEQHVEYKGVSYDVTVYSIVTYFDLCLNGNPNMLDSLFVPDNCVLYSSQVGQLIRENRKLFLTKRCWHTFKGYAYSQKSDVVNTNHRPELVERYGYDTKAAYHLVRLLLEVEMILTEGDMDLQRHSEYLRSIRTGQMSMTDITNFFSDKEKQLEAVYHTSTLPYATTDVEPYVKTLLVKCIEYVYGDISRALVLPGTVVDGLSEIIEVATRLLNMAKLEKR